MVTLSSHHINDLSGCEAADRVGEYIDPVRFYRTLTGLPLDMTLSMLNVLIYHRFQV